MKKVLNVKIPASKSFASATTSTENNKSYAVPKHVLLHRDENNNSSSSVSRSQQPSNILRTRRNSKVTTAATTSAVPLASATMAKLPPIITPPRLGVKSEPSPRLIQLSKPRRIEKQAPLEIMKRMPSRILKAKATDRTIELSQPRKPSQTERTKTKSLSKRALQSLVSRLTRIPNHRKPQQLFPVDNFPKKTYRK